MRGQRGSDRSLRQRCTALIGDLDIPDPFDLDQFCRGLARQRGRTLRLRPMRAGIEDACGFWIATTVGDYLFYEAATTPAHRLHIVFHELGHLLFDHSGGLDLGCDLLDLLDQLSPDLIRRMLGRIGYDTPDEREAETFACVLGEHIGLGTGFSGDPSVDPELLFATGTDPVLAAQLNRLIAILEHPTDRTPAPCTH